jgi:hypothetical protein
MAKKKHDEVAEAIEMVRAEYSPPAEVEVVEEEVDLQPLVTKMIERAIAHYEEELEPDQVKATDYYWTRAVDELSEEEGRSKVMSSDVRDATQFQVPSLLDIFFGQESVVEYRADSPQGAPPQVRELKIAQAAQATDYVNAVIMEDNPGFLVFDAIFKDALIRRVGIVKWWWETFYRVEGHEYEGLSQEQFQTLAADPEVDLDISSIQQNDDGTFNVSLVRRNENGGCVRIAAVPPNEVAWTPNAPGFDDTIPLVVHHRDVAVDYAVALLGEEHREYIEEQAGRSRADSSEGLQSARQFHDGDTADNDDDTDASQKHVLLAEAYCLIDGDGDGTAELRKCLCVGPQFTILNGKGRGEIVDEIPMAIITPEPEPHAIVGMGNYDLLKDVQLVKSQSLRGMLNSLAQAIEPKTEVVTGEVNMGDLLNPEVNGIVRVRRPGMMREVKHSFVGPDVLPVLQYYDEIKENRTGTSRAAMGLNADALQSSTKLAVSGTLTMAQRRVRYIARVFAETGMKRLFKGLLKLIVRHQDRPRNIRLRGAHVDVDPRTWDQSMDVTINVGLGDGNKEEKLAGLERLYAAQVEQYANGSPLVKLSHIRNTLSRFSELLGFKNSAEFFEAWGPEQDRMLAEAQAAQPPQPDPNMALVQVEQAKAQAQAQIDMMKLQLEQEKIRLQDDRERDKIAMEHSLKVQEMEMKYQMQIQEAALRNEIERERMQMDADIKREQAKAAAAPIQFARREA